MESLVTRVGHIMSVLESFSMPGKELINIKLRNTANLVKDLDIAAIVQS